MSLKLVSESHLHCIMKCNIVVAVPLTCHLIIGMTVLMKELVDGDIENEWNLLDISDSPMSCMLLISQ